MDQAGFQQLASQGGAQAVFDYAQQNGISLDQLAQIGGVSSSEMANLAQSQGINTGMLSQIGYTAPPANYASGNTQNTTTKTPTKEYFQSLGSGKAVFDYAVQNNLTLDDLARIGGVSRNDMVNLAQQNGISTGALSQIGYSVPEPTYTQPVAGTPAISGQTGMMDVTTGQFNYFGTKAYDDWLNGITPELLAYGITPDQYLAGGVGARLMSNPLTDAYSSAFAENNVNGGGQAWAQSVGGPIGFGKANGYVDATGYSTGLGDPGGKTNSVYASYVSSTNPNYASGNQPGQGLKTNPNTGGGNTGGGNTGGGNTGSGGYGGGYGGGYAYQGPKHHIAPSSPFLERSKAGGWFNFGAPPTNNGGYDPLRPFGGGLPPLVNQTAGAPNTVSGNGFTGYPVSGQPVVGGLTQYDPVV
jgi:hypothetical protein